MLRITLKAPSDFAGWRQAARALAIRNIAPDQVVWTVPGATAGLFDDASTTYTAQGIAEASQPEIADVTFSVPRAFVDLAQHTALYRDPARFTLLYRMLWRLRDEHRLLDLAPDPDVVLANAWAKAVRRDIHKMHAFVRFRTVTEADEEHYIAWYEPDHHVVEVATPFFMRRFATLRWTILTPECSADWDGKTLDFGSGVAKPQVETDDALEDLWRRYYVSIFNPARVNPKAMQAEMPKKFWRNLPEASLIQPLIREAAGRTREMVEKAPDAPVIRRGAALGRQEAAALAQDNMADGNDLASLRTAALVCKLCPLWEPATQTVFGVGPAEARIVLVGEQPGDQEDIRGLPFVGPAGQLLDRALCEAGIDRRRIYVTNAVKHFKFLLRGKRRIHQKPGTVEIRACSTWLERELAFIEPTHVVAMGATAVQAVFGRTLPIGQNRGAFMPLEPALPDNGKNSSRTALITVHPSYLLRLPDEEAKQREYRSFVEDLALLRDFQ